MKSTDREWLSIAEAADIVGVEHRTIRRMAARGELTVRKLGNTRILRVSRADLERALVPVPSAK